MRKILKATFLTCFAMLGTFLMGLTLLLFFLRTESGQAWAIHQLASYVKSQTKMEFKWSNISFSFPLQVNIEELVLSQEGQPVAKIKQATLSFGYQALWEGRLICSAFKMHEVDLLKNPFPPSSVSFTSDPSEKPPLLPFYIKVENIDIQNVRLHAPLIEELSLPPQLAGKASHSLWHLKGMIRNHPLKQEIAAHLVLTIQEDQVSSFAIDMQNHQLSFSGHLDPALLREWNPRLPEKLKGHFAFHASASMEDWEHLWKKKFPLESYIEGHFKLSIDPSTSLSSRYRLKSMEEIELFEAKLLLPSSTLALEGKVKGPWQTPTVFIHLESPSLHMISALQSDMRFVVEADKINGFLSLSFDYQQLPWKIDSPFEWNSSHALAFSDLKMKGKNADIQGNLFYSFEEGEHRLRGRLTGYHLKEGEWQAKEFSWEGEIKDRTLIGNWKAIDLQKGEIRIAQAQGNVHLLHPFQGSAEGTIVANMQQLQTSSMQVDSLELTTHFHPNHPFSPFVLKGKGRFKEAWEMAMQGEWQWDGPRCEWHVTQLNGHWGPYPLSLQQPLFFSKEGDQKLQTRFHLALGEASLQADFKQEGDHISSHFKTSAVPSEFFPFILPDLPLSGKATFTGHLNGTWEHPEGGVDIQLHRIQVKEEIFARQPFIEGLIHLTLDQGRGMKVHSTLSGIGQTPVVVFGTLPLRFPSQLSPPQIDTNLPFHLAIQAEGLLDPYVRLFYEDIKSLSAETKIDLEISGEMKAPQINGKISVWNGTYESLRTGASYHHIEAVLEGKGTEMVLTHFSAHDKRGQLTASGKVDLNWRQHFPFTFHLQSSNVLLIDSDYASLFADGPLTLSGNFKHSKLEGHLSIHQAEIYLGESLPRSVKTVDVQYINLPAGEKISSAPNKSSALEFDLKLHADRILIQGKGLSSQWKGEIHVLGTPKNPLLHGDLHLTRGEYFLKGKPLTLSQGTIHFGGDPRKKTTLYVVASKEIDPMFSEPVYQGNFDHGLPNKNIDYIHAEIIVKGPIDRPGISFRSTPPLSQREVLSYILFNRGISDITSDQGDVLSESFISLNSSEKKSDTDDFLSRIRNNIGIDRLDLITGDKWNPDLGLQVGKYLTPNVLVSLNHSMNTLTPVVAIEAKLKKHWKAQAESGLGGDNNPVRFSLKWKKDY